MEVAAITRSTLCDLNLFNDESIAPKAKHEVGSQKAVLLSRLSVISVLQSTSSLFTSARRRKLMPKKSVRKKGEENTDPELVLPCLPTCPANPRREASAARCLRFLARLGSFVQAKSL